MTWVFLALAGIGAALFGFHLAAGIYMQRAWQFFIMAPFSLLIGIYFAARATGWAP